MNPLPTSRIAVLVSLLSLISVSSVFAQHAGDRAPVHPRSHELHAISDKILPARPGRARPPQDLIDLRAALSALALAVSSAQSDATTAHLSGLRSQHATAEAALRKLLRGYRTSGALEIANELDALFAPLWTDLEGAQASVTGRSHHLDSATARIRDALANGNRSHGTGVTTLKLGAER